MAIADADRLTLWGKAAGLCSNPGCRRDLFEQLTAKGRFHLGEMAHVIAHQPEGPRGDGVGGNDTYDNLLLLCPTCHTLVDKASDDYPPERLRDWKSQHEAAIRQAGSDVDLESFDELRVYIKEALMTNRAIFDAFGPRSRAAQDDPSSNAADLWAARKLDTIAPNNLKMVNVIRRHRQLLTTSQMQAFIDFQIHAQAFSNHCYNRIDNYPTFPRSFEREFS